MEAETGKVAERAREPAAIRRQQRLRRVLHQQKAMRRRYLAQGIHLSAHPGIMHDEDRLGARRNRRLRPDAHPC